jgi:hypothetical protein
MSKQPGLFGASLPPAPVPGDVAWCSYPASPPAADCLTWRKGLVKVPADCAGCMFCKEPAT